MDEAIKVLIPETALTLHRLLGGRPDSTRIAYDRDHPLALDVLVVDEVSMVDLALMTKLVEALPPQARLILVGDRDQLASVEPGAVLDSLCADRNAYTPAFVSRLGAVVDGELPLEPGAVSSLRDTTVLLDRSRRFGMDSGIARLARAVQAGHADAAVDILHAGGDVVWRQGPPDPSAIRRTLQAPMHRFADAVRAGDSAETFASLEAFRVLTAVRHGPVGVHWLNEVLERLLKEELSAGGHRPWFAGKAVMVNRNHRGLSLFNGDIGVTLASGEDQGLRVVFRSADNTTRALMPARLPAHELAYALTVHKSQGSEFDEVLVLLPRADSPVLTRELLYTAITRARRRVEIWASEAAIRASIGRRTQRGSGLREACWATVGAVAP